MLQNGADIYVISGQHRPHRLPGLSIGSAQLTQPGGKAASSAVFRIWLMNCRAEIDMSANYTANILENISLNSRGVTAYVLRNCVTIRKMP